MVWGDDKPIDTTATAAFDRLDSTMAFTAVGDEDLAAMRPTQTLDDVPPARHLGAHRKQRRVGLTWRQTGAVVAVGAAGAVVFAVVLASASHHSPNPVPIRQAAPEAAVVTPSPTPMAKPKPAPARPAEPVVRRQDPPVLPVRQPPVHTVTMTITATPKATPTPKPTSSSPKPTVEPTPGPTSPGPVETSAPADPNEEPTPATEAPDGDN